MKGSIMAAAGCAWLLTACGGGGTSTQQPEPLQDDSTGPLQGARTTGAGATFLYVEQDAENAAINGTIRSSSVWRTPAYEASGRTVVQRVGQTKLVIAQPAGAARSSALASAVAPSALASDHSSRIVGVDVTADIDLDPSVEVDGSEAVHRRLTPASTSTHVAAFDEGSQRSVGLRPASTMVSTSYVAVKVNAWGSTTRSTSTTTRGEDRSALVEDL